MIRPCSATPIATRLSKAARIDPIFVSPPTVDVRGDGGRARTSMPAAASEAMPVQSLQIMSPPRWQTVRSVALLLAVASTALLGAQRAGADIIHFRDGMKTVCQGKAWEEKDEVRCEYGGGVLIYPKADVQTIERRPAPDPPTDPPEKQAVRVPGPASETPPAPPPARALALPLGLTNDSAVLF